jgi:hypothetical protein
MKLDFNIVSQGGKLDFEIKNTKTINASCGIGEDVVRDIVAEATADLQPKTDETLKTQSKEIVGAINEVNSGLVKEMGSSVNEETNVLTIELKDKSGKVIATTQVTIPKGEVPDLSAYVKTEDRDEFVRGGLTETTETWTEEDKTKALELLGALKADTSSRDTNKQRVYAIAKDGTQIILDVAIFGTPAPTNIPIYGGGGQISVGNPTIYNSATPKTYIDNLPDNLTLTDDERAKWRAWLGIE